MRKHLLGLMLIAGMAGCTSESGVAPADNPGDTTANGPDAAPTAASLAATRGSTSSFASLPDRGELLAYGGARKARKEGAYTWHPVSISEEHALNAIGGGRMVVNTPDGQALDLRYERHEEQPDGNWSWIGRSEDGASAVLTFGEKAVFGSIARGDAQYRVRTDRSGAWMVETDPRLVAANGGRPKDGNDVLMPPESRALAAAAARRLGSKAASGEVPAKAIAVIDLVLGYSSTIATELGSQSAAVTLVTNLAAAANAAYTNSGVSMRLRVVHAMSVNYADTTSNREALQQLTGYNADTQQPITPNASFNALRAARDEFGGDLVALIRRYREPQQDGCGIAWLLGMNQSGIGPDDEAFGYAVVSDGVDQDEGDGNSYFCSNYSLAHELGHLMGQAHDRDNADDAGVHPYSYGYRESSSTGFFTIMAYPNGNQLEAPYFANPAVRWQNRPTGTADADNVRSMNQTMPVVSRFRATVVPLLNVRNDFDGDGKSDIFFRNLGDGRNVIWKSANSATQQSTATVSGRAWTVVGTGDFNGDGKFDVLWRNTANGQNAIWRSGSGSSADSQSLATVADQNWKVAGVGDFNGDGRADILWRHAVSGRNVIWASGNSAAQIAVATVAHGGWRVAGVGDFNGDGRDDILWRSTDGRNTIWLSGSNAAQTSVATVSGNAWKIVGIGDFNGDGRSDVLWRHTDGRNTIWLSANNATQLAVATIVNNAWRVASIADFDGDGRADIFWRSTDGRNVIWRSANSGTQTAATTVSDAAWQVMPQL